MTVLVNNFEEGTSGTTISTGNSGGSGSNAFDGVSIGTSCTLTFDNTHAAHGSLALKVALGATAASDYVLWSTSLGSVTQAWFRQYLYFTATPSTFPYVMGFQESGGTTVAAMSVNGSGNLVFDDSTFTAQITTTAAIPLNQWFRIEGFVVGSATVGQLSLSLYDTMDSTSATETHTTGATLNTAGQVGQVSFGQLFSQGTSTTWWVDDVGVSTTGLLGPVTPAAVFPSALQRQVARVASNAGVRSMCHSR